MSKHCMQDTNNIIIRLSENEIRIGFFFVLPYDLYCCFEYMHNACARACLLYAAADDRPTVGGCRRRNRRTITNTHHYCHQRPQSFRCTLIILLSLHICRICHNRSRQTHTKHGDHNYIELKISLTHKQLEMIDRVCCCSKTMKLK